MGLVFFGILLNQGTEELIRVAFWRGGFLWITDGYLATTHHLSIHPPPIHLSIPIHSQASILHPSSHTPSLPKIDQMRLMYPVASIQSYPMPCHPMPQQSVTPLPKIPTSPPPHFLPSPAPHLLPSPPYSNYPLHLPTSTPFPSLPLQRIRSSGTLVGPRVSMLDTSGVGKLGGEKGK